MENAKLDLKYTGRWGIIYNGYVSYIENCVSEMNLGKFNLTGMDFEFEGFSFRGLFLP